MGTYVAKLISHFSTPPGKRRIIGVENAVDEDEFDDIPPLANLIKPFVPLKDATPYLRKDHNEKLKNVFKKKAKKSRTRHKRAN